MPHRSRVSPEPGLPQRALHRPLPGEEPLRAASPVQHPRPPSCLHVSGRLRRRPLPPVLPPRVSHRHRLSAGQGVRPGELCQPLPVHLSPLRTRRGMPRGFPRGALRLPGGPAGQPAGGVCQRGVPGGRRLSRRPGLRLPEPDLRSCLQSDDVRGGRGVLSPPASARVRV